MTRDADAGPEPAARLADQWVSRYGLKIAPLGECVMRHSIALLILAATALPAAAQDKSYEIHAPGRTFEIQKPRDKWQVPGEIQVPKGIQAVKSVTVSRCERRLSVVADALFDFDKHNLRAEA